VAPPDKKTAGVIPGTVYSNLGDPRACTLIFCRLRVTPACQQKLQIYLQGQKMRSSSGVTPITLFSKPYNCGGSCIFCPSVTGVPKSYLSRVNLSSKCLSYSPDTQMAYWLSYIRGRGGVCNKLEVLILGGSFLALPIAHIRWFVRKIYQSIDGSIRPGAKVADYIEKHQSTDGYRIIGITVEARPDQINKSIVVQLYSLGVTKIEIGVQSVNEDVLSFNKRGHDINSIKNATSIIKDKGLKVGYHLLYGMPSASIKIDIDSTREIFTNPSYLPDHVKLYFCEMFKREFMTSEIVRLYDSQSWKPYDYEHRAELLNEITPLIPRYTRISRIGRKLTRHDLEVDLIETPSGIHDRKFGCKCIRCREPENKIIFDYRESQIALLEISDRDIFIEQVCSDTDTCFGVLRLRKSGNNIAIIREIHVYGLESAVGDHGKFQHHGIGKRLIRAAERAATEKWGVNHLGVASGVGVRSYFEKYGFKLGDDCLMWKEL